MQQKTRTDWDRFHCQSTQFGKMACETDMASTKKRPYETVPWQADNVLRRSKRYRTAGSLSNVFKGCSEKKGAKYLEAVSRKITECRGQKYVLKNPDGAILFIGPVEDTEYDDSPADVYGWGNFFLPETVEMKVIGYVTGTPFPCDQFVLMTCEDKQVFGYDGEKLYLVASSLNKLCCEGLAYPEIKSYYFGEAFKHMTEDDWEKVKQGPVEKTLEEEHRKLLASFDSTYLEVKNNTCRLGGIDQELDCIKPSGVHLSAAIPYTQYA